MADLPCNSDTPEPRDQVLVIGAGIVGCSTAFHLAQLGVTDVLVVEQGPLFATGGSRSHAQTNPSQTMTELASYTVPRRRPSNGDGTEAPSEGGCRAPDLRRFEGFAHSPSYVAERTAQSFCEIYDIIHPQRPPEHPRPPEQVFSAAEPKRGAAGFTTSASYGHTVGTSLAYARPPAALGKEGTGRRVACFDQRHPATVVADSLLDPEMRRMRC